VPTRRRLPPDDARRLILEAAETLLREGGIQAVQVREVARRAGMTDAGVAYHFGTRDQLLERLLKHGGRRLRTALRSTVEDWLDDNADVGSIVWALATVYQDGYTELALALHAAGWRDDGLGLLDDVVDALHQRVKPGYSKQDVRLTIAALHQAVALEPFFGPAFRRSAGVGRRHADSSRDQLQWWTQVLDQMIDNDIRNQLSREP
jgi:AcrR family transcriptional regulator